MENKDGFSFTYCAAQQQEVAHIRKKYLPKEEDKMSRLRDLDRIPAQKAQAASITIGVIGTLLLGTGMSMVMTDIAAVLGTIALILGIAIGCIGLVMVALAYPIYDRVLRIQRKRIAPEILRLTDELLK